MAQKSKTLPRTELLSRVGRLAQVAGVTVGEYVDGPERHVRYVDMHSGSGLDLRVLIDRGFDLGEMRIEGVPVAWRSPTGFRSPYLSHSEEESGAGLLRSFDGLLVTCGLDHIRGAATGPATHFGPRRDSVNYTMHGRISSSPAQLTGYGETWDGDSCTLWCEGLVRQAMLYGESLSLRRRVEMRLGESRVDIIDRVQNDGFRPCPHMLMYHVNFGYPLLDEGAELMLPYECPDTPQINASRARMAVQPVPTKASAPDELLDLHIPSAGVPPSSSMYSCGVINDRLHGGLAIELKYDSTTLPHLQVWRNLSEGIYVLALEPSTHMAKKRAELEQAGAITQLLPGEYVDYRIALEAHVGALAISALRNRNRGA